MRRLALAFGLLSLAGCATVVDRQAATARARIDEARWSEAYRCAPAELARAEVHLDLARFELDGGDPARALSHVADAEEAAAAAILRARPCAPKVRPDDLDGDGVANAADRCPNAAGAPDRFGCPDTDGDLVFDDIDRCRLEAEDRDGFRDDDGCPDLDDDGDGIADAFDRCRLQPGPVENAGCPGPVAPAVATVAAAPAAPAPAAVPAAPAASGRVIVKDGRLELAEKLAFKPFAGDLLPASHAILREVARVLKENPKLAVRIEGHTDSRGNAQVNTWLSRVRPKAVKDFLVKEGVAASRLSTVGHGSSRPIAPNTTEAGREANRRIEFVIVSP